MMEAREILKDLIAINTVADKGNREIMDYLQAFYEKLGIEVERLISPITGKEVLIASYGENPVIGFMGHTDTVDITDGWETEPFTLTEKEDGMLYGLGACDMKGGMACWMAAIANTDLSKTKKGFKCFHTYDEEILFHGIRDLIRIETEFPEHMIIAEPTDGTPVIGSKGLLEYVLTFKGVTTHSSTPIEGKSSNKNAVRFLNRMMEFEEELKKNKFDFFGVPFSTMNIGIINGGTSINKVPAETVVYLDFRICDSNKEYGIIRNCVDTALESLDGSYEIINDIPSFYNRGELEKRLEKITNCESMPFNGITEASFIGGDRVIFGPGPHTSHESNEHVSAKSLDKTQNTFEEILRQMCQTEE